MARAGLCLAALLAGCGLVSKDFDVEQQFEAGGMPGFSGSLDATRLTSPLSSDVSKISSITLKAARVEATDGKDVSFVSTATISISSQVLADKKIADLAAPAAAGQTSVQLVVDSSTELKPYLQAGGSVSANITYAPTPVTTRTLKLVLTLHGSLL